FAFNDPDFGQSLANVRIDSVPVNGVLSVNGSTVVAGQLVSAADIGAGRLVFTPAANGNGAPYAGFNFSVQDSAGGYATTPNRFTLDVTPVNDAPVAAADTVASTAEDMPAVISAASLLANDTDVDGD